MALAVFDIHDAGIQVALDGELIRTSPGYAVLDKQRLMTGESAAGHAKLLPRWTNNRFWSQLDTNPLPNGTGRVRHHADLAFAHLEELWAPVRDRAGQVILCVPGYYSQENLGLLLGITREAGMPVRGLVDSAVVAASNLALPPKALHLDIHLHSITLTRLTNSGLLTRAGVQTLVESGLVNLWERWADVIAKQFIRTSRFDPMHEAATEQTLFDLLPAWVAALDEQAMNRFDLKAGDTTRSVTVARDSLLTAVTGLYPRIVQALRRETDSGGPACLLLSHRFTGFPGLKESLGLVKHLEVIALPETGSVIAANEHRDAIISPDEAISHVTRMRADRARLPPAAVVPSRPTHILFDNHAYAIGHSFKLGADFPARSDEPMATLYVRRGMLMLEPAHSSVKINGEACDGSRALRAGDLLDLGEVQLTLITVGKDA